MIRIKKSKKKDSLSIKYSDILSNFREASWDEALEVATTGHSNASFGHRSSHACTTGHGNTTIGPWAGESVTTGDENVLIGRFAGSGQITTGDKNLYIARDNVAHSNAGAWIYGNSVGKCYQGDNSQHFQTTSDRRLKKNIVDNTRGLAEIDQLRVANFEYRTREEIDMSEFPLAAGPHQVVIGEGNEGVHTGIIAQELEAVLPECITTDELGAKTVNTDPIIWAFLNAIKELSTKVKALEAK